MSEYIDREQALLEIEEWADTFCECDYVWPHVIESITKLPAADVRPVVRGRWVGNKRHQSCSECHMTYCVPDGQDGELDMTAYHFCPNCGADMRPEPPKEE